MAAAKHLFGVQGLDPIRWCVNKAQLQEFDAQVRQAFYWKEICNETPPNLPAYPQHIFDNPELGPNIHQAYMHMDSHACVYAQVGIFV